MRLMNDKTRTEIFWFDDNCGPLSNRLNEFLLMEVPVSIIDQLETQLKEDDVNNRHNEHSDNSPVKVLQFLKAEEYNDSNDPTIRNSVLATATPFTTSISQDELLVGQIQKTSTSMVVGVLGRTIQHVDDESIIHNDSNLNEYSVIDCVYIGEKQSVLTLQPTFPRVQQIYQYCNLNFSSNFLTV